MSQSFPDKTFKHDIQRVQGLRSRESRETTGKTLIEGIPETRRAMTAGIHFEVVYICKEFLDVDPEEFASLPLKEVPKDVFKMMAFGSRYKGILSVAKPPIFKLTDLNLSENPLIIICEAVEKPGNLGTIIRTCDGAGVDAVVFANKKTDVYNHHIVRSSVGTVFHVPTVSATNEEVYSFLKEKKISIALASAQASEYYADIRFDQPLAIIVGNEHAGVSEFWNERADHRLFLPMNGTATSLNVGVCASILIYEAHRQRRN